MEFYISGIDVSDLVLVVIKGETVSRAMSVGQEIGHAQAMGKSIIPIVTPEVSASNLGLLSGITYQRIDRYNPKLAIRAIENLVLRKKEQIEELMAVFIVGGIVGLKWLASKSSD